jgi:hypothetical protein
LLTLVAAKSGAALQRWQTLTWKSGAPGFWPSVVNWLLDRQGGRVPMMRAIDKGLAASKIGLVLVTPALLARLPKEGVADKELSTLLQGNRLVPIVHGTTYTALRDVSPMLASRSGLDTSEDTMAVVATKIAELVAIWS